MSRFISTKAIELGSTAFRQPNAESHCKQIHGYRLKAKIWLGCNELDKNNWVFDFGSFKELKETLEKTFDHTLVIDKKDPAKSVFRELERYGAAKIIEMDGVGIEKFAEFVFNQTDTYVKFKTNNRVWCLKVEVFEHENNSAIYVSQNEEVKESVPPVVKEIVKESIKEESPEQVKEVPKAQNSPTPAPLHNPVSSTSSSKPNGPQPVPLNNPVTTGWSNPFAGTSWGA